MCQNTYRLGQPNWEYKMWKYHDFSAIQILCEINFGHVEAQKIFRHAEYESARRDLNFLMGKELDLLVFRLFFI